MREYFILHLVGQFIKQLKFTTMNFIRYLNCGVIWLNQKTTTFVEIDIK